MYLRLKTFFIFIGSTLSLISQNLTNVIQDSTTVLKEIVVTAQKVKVKEDGMNYTISNIQGSDLADAGTMLDMMAWTPGLSLDAAENIQVFGVSGSPLVYINGVKVTDKSKLASLSSNMVKKIEVIRAPGAEYPSGTNSVIKNYHDHTSERRYKCQSN